MDRPTSAGRGADRLRKVSERARRPPGDRGEPVELSPVGDAGRRCPTPSTEVTHLGPRKRAAVCCRSLGEGCPQGPGSLAVQAHHRGLQNGLQQPGKVLLKEPQVLATGTQVTVGAFRWAHTWVCSGRCPQTAAQLLVPLHRPWKGGREPACRPAPHGAKRGGAPSLGVCAS